MFKRAMTYGLLATAGGAAWTLIEYALGFHGARMETGRYTGFVAIAFPILAIWLALRAARAERGGMSFGRGFAEGAAVSGVHAVSGALFFAFYFGFINPGFFKRLAEAGQTSSASEQVTLMLVSSLVAGLLISLVAAALMRTRSPA